MPRRTLVVLLFLAAAVCVLPAQTDISKIGPQVGDTAIGFSLVDQTGKSQTLKSVAGPKGTMLVFFRSADW